MQRRRKEEEEEEEEAPGFWVPRKKREKRREVGKDVFCKAGMRKERKGFFANVIVVKKRRKRKGTKVWNTKILLLRRERENEVGGF